MFNFPTLNELAPQIGEAERRLWDLDTSDGADRYWRHEQFAVIPEAFQATIADEYTRRWNDNGERSANLYLLDISQRITRLGIDLCMTDDELVDHAKQLAQTCQKMLQNTGCHVFTAHHLLTLCREHSIHPPAGLEHYVEKHRNRRANIGTTAQRRATPPTLASSAPNRAYVAATRAERLPTGILARLTGEAWWRRKLRALYGRALESEAIRQHKVHRLAGLYVSDETLTRHQHQQRRNLRTLATLLASNEDGEVLELIDIISKSLANPTNRRAELMIRIYGFDQLAQKLGHEALLLTVTCPSRMHSHLGKSGTPNPAYDQQSTPRDAQQYLTTLWARIRAHWKRHGIVPYGLRITEPHHDGTPHWHILIFIDPQHRDAMVETVRTYALADSPDEPGAAKHRFQLENIDRAKGSATGYVAKYISKNIDGYGLDSDGTTSDAGNRAKRVTAWSSTWGVRQFQQFGGPPVGIWRELRRTPRLGQPGTLVRALAEAADTADWATFVELLGGPQASRKNIEISLAKKHHEQLGRYGEPMGERVIGIQHKNVVFTTRIHTWSILQKTKPPSQPYRPNENAPRAAGCEPWSSVNNCTQRSLLQPDKSKAVLVGMAGLLYEAGKQSHMLVEVWGS